MDQLIDFQSLIHDALGGNARIIDPPKRLTVRPSGEMWEVATSHGVVVVRRVHPHPADVHFNSESELAILAIATAHGFAPKTLFVDHIKGILVTERPPGKLWGPRDARTPRNIGRIASLLRRLHALEAPPQSMSIDIHRILLSYWNTLMEQGQAGQAGSAKARSRIKKLLENFAEKGPRSICHTAIFHSNIVDNGDLNETTSNGLTLIDWEYAGVGDPIFDLAGMCCHHAFSAELRAALIREYMGAENAAACKRLDNACVLITYVRELWFTAREV